MNPSSIALARIPEASLDSHIAVLGMTGSGKTSTAKLAVEQVVASGGRVCILDPIKSDWWGMVLAADGKKPGLPFTILGGPKGHLPLPVKSGKAIAEVVASGALPLSILDMADFGPGGQGTFFGDFAETLYKRVKGVVHLVIEEAHTFAPKQQTLKEEPMSIFWAKRLASASRTKGLRVIVCTQRTQSLHNDLLSSCETVIAHRMTFPADQKTITDWIKAKRSKEEVETVGRSLSSLADGEGWIIGARAGMVERVRFARNQTYDNTSTPTAGQGESVRVPSRRSGVSGRSSPRTPWAASTSARPTSCGCTLPAP